MAVEKDAPKTVHATKSHNEQGKDMAMAGFAIAIASIFTNIFTFGVMAIAGLVLSIIGRVQTSKAGRPNNYALAGIIISASVMVLTFMAFIFFVTLAILAASEDERSPSNIHCDGSLQDMYVECKTPEQLDTPSNLYPHTQS